MMADDWAKLWNLRRASVARFIAEPERFKECEQCRSISLKGAAICQWCGGYRFLEDPKRVRATAREMGTRPYSLAAAVVPRLASHGGDFDNILSQSDTRLNFHEVRSRQKLKLTVKKDNGTKSIMLKPFPEEKTSDGLHTTVPFGIPEEKYRKVKPRLVGTAAIKVYMGASMFWAVARKGGIYSVDFVALGGRAGRGYNVTPQAAARFICYTNHPMVLVAQTNELGWKELNWELTEIVMDWLM